MHFDRRMSHVFGPPLVAALVLVGCGGPAAPAASKATPVAPAVAVAVTPARDGSITQTSVFTGDVKATAQVAVFPKQSGRILSEPVGIGTKVQTGDVLARLDHQNLDLDLETAQAQLKQAQAKVDAIRAGARPENVTVAQTQLDTEQARLQAELAGPKPGTVAQALAQVDSAQQKLDALLHPRAENVAQAQLQLQQAQQKLAGLVTPRPETVTQARLNRDQAQQKLAAIEAGPKASDVAQAESNLATAQARLQALTDPARQVDLAPLQLAVEAAKDALFSAQATRDGLCGQHGPAYQCQAANSQVDAAQTQVNAAQATLNQKLAAPRNTDLQQAKAAVAQAQAALEAAKHPYTAQDVQQAQDSVKYAQQQLDLAKQPAAPQAVAQAQESVALAQQQLSLAQHPGSPQEVKQATDAVAQAQASLLQAQQPYSDQDIRQARDAVVQAQAQLALAEKPYTTPDRETALASLAQSQASVDQALQAIKDATVRAPVAGFITAKNLAQGAFASPSASIVTIASDHVKIQIPVEESQLPDLRAGQQATITSSVLGAKQVPGTVATIAPSGDTQNRTFTVDIVPTQQSDLMPGMFVRVAIHTIQHQHVLIVPKGSVVQRSGKPFVFVVQNKIAHQMPVTLGLTSDTMTEIATGLTPGASVVVQGQQDLNDGDHVTIVAGQLPAAG